MAALVYPHFSHSVLRPDPEAGVPTPTAAVYSSSGTLIPGLEFGEGPRRFLAGRAEVSECPWRRDFELRIRRLPTQTGFFDGKGDNYDSQTESERTGHLYADIASTSRSDSIGWEMARGSRLPLPVELSLLDSNVLDHSENM